MMTQTRLPSSFRDPSGFVFHLDGVVYRQVNQCYREHYDHLMRSGLYYHLVASGLLIEHTVAGAGLAQTAEAYTVIQPEPIPFISYPYEWCFGQLKAAALVTLAVQRKALAFGLSLKDASAYNVQFMRGQPRLIDTLSFETYREGAPWTPYRQFCQHWLAPLALMSYTDVRLSQLLRVYIDGVPLDLAAGLLPWTSHLNMALKLHIHLHARSQKRWAGAPVALERRQRGVSRHALLGILDHLETTIEQLRWNPQTTAWAGYTPTDSYTADGLEHKQSLVSAFLEQADPRSVWDIGANTGLFSRIASRSSRLTISFDSDPGAVELNYRQMVQEHDPHLLPLLLDLTNPSPAIGWDNQERGSWLERGQADTVLALALVHHLAIANNVPLNRLAQFFARLGRWLIVEFVPKSDPWAQRLLAARKDIFPDYTQAGFESIFGSLFNIRRVERIRASERVLFLMEKR